MLIREPSPSVVNLSADAAACHGRFTPALLSGPGAEPVGSTQAEALLWAFFGSPTRPSSRPSAESDRLCGSTEGRTVHALIFPVTRLITPSCPGFRVPVGSMA